MTWLFSLASFWSAFLLFLVQPMIGKLLLPSLGGAPAVWITCSLAFQSLLLAGYVAAHFLVRIFGSERHPLVHFALLLATIPLLPEGTAIEPPGDVVDHPVWWIFRFLGTTVGTPFLALSMTSPVLQKWFSQARSGGVEREPWFLFGASNAGSLLGLASYPLLIEPGLTTQGQRLAWNWAYVVFVLMAGGCAFFASRRQSPGGPESKAEGNATTGEGLPIPGEPGTTPGGGQQDGEPPEGWGRVFQWVLASFIPSSLMLGTTAHVTGEIAQIPLLWVLPLGLYLLTFILTFSSVSFGTPELFGNLFAGTLCIYFPILMEDIFSPIWLSGGLAMMLCFTGGMTFHGFLVSRRPRASRLTAFYIWISLGGLLGGIFNGLVSPKLFRTVMEYPLVFMLASLFLPSSPQEEPGGRKKEYLAWGAVAVLVWVTFWSNGGLSFQIAGSEKAFMVFLGGAGLWNLCFRRRGWGVFFAGTIAISIMFVTSSPSALIQARSFFGSMQVIRSFSGRHHLLQHGNIHHGGQCIEPGKTRTPLFYYPPDSPIAGIFKEFRFLRRAKKVGIVGLGTGAMAAFSRPFQEFVFFEIDPVIARIASDTRYFSFLAEAEGKIRVVLGDGRMSLRQEPDSEYEILVFDAYFSDSIPVHLLTREALELFFRKLKPDGILVFHISNRYLDLEPVLGNLGKAMGMSVYSNSFEPPAPMMKYEEDAPYVFRSHWVMAARRKEDFGRLLQDSGWQPAMEDPNHPVWTDDYSNLFSVLRWD